MRDDINNFTFPVTKELIPGKYSKHSKIITLDGSEWRVFFSTKVVFSKKITWPWKRLVDEIKLDITLRSPEDDPWKSDIDYSFEITSPKNPNEKYRARMDDWGFSMKIKDLSFPLANYLFSLNKSSQKKEIRNIARQILE